jgi:hypothetical protein
MNMQWPRMHPYLSASLTAGALLILGALIVHQRTAPPPSGSIAVWGGSGTTLINPTSYTPNASPGGSANAQIGTTSTALFVPLMPAQNAGGGSDTSQASTFDMSAFLASLSPSSVSGNTSTSSQPDLSLAYAFIPSGLVATTTPGPNRTSLQTALYEYGNNVGSYIQTYEHASGNAAQVLQDQVADRQNPQKAQAVQNIATALQAVGHNLESLDGIPSVAASANTALAQSYIDMGTKLALIPQAQSDQDFINAIEAYDAAAQVFTKQYVALANIFVGTSVTFAPQDPGSVFSFTVSSGL